MIHLKSVTGKEFYLNCDLIYKVEMSYDTLITLTDQKTLRVMDTPEEVTEKVRKYKQSIYQTPWEMEE